MRPADHLIWLLILLLGAGTYTLRLSFIHLMSRGGSSRRFQRHLRYVPSAVLSALVLPALLAPGAPAEPAPARLAAGALAAVVAWWSRSVVLTLLSGMSALWLLQEVLS